jgi:uncharacterized peroxidase-related enzyme
MAWIRTIDESEAEGPLEELYGAARQQHGFVANILKAHSLKPELMAKWQAFAGAVTFGGSSLGRRREEMVAVLVSSLLMSRYCTISHGAMLCATDPVDDTELVMMIKRDFRVAGLSAQDEAMLEYAEQITIAPHTATESDIDTLRDHGFEDVEILEIAALAAYRNYIARVASALGVVPDDVHFQSDPETRRALGKGTV